MSSIYLIAVANHLWQSTLFAAAIACLTLLVRKNGARARYCLWLAASAKFLIPFALLAAIGAHIPWHLGQARGTEPTFVSFVGHIAAHVAQLGGPDPRALTAPAASAPGSVNLVLIAVASFWALGTVIVFGRWLTRWSLVRRALRASTPTSLAFTIPVRTSSSQLEPAVVGVLRPVVLIPQGLEQRLTSEEMRAILAHERCHVAWRDNLTAALHMVVEALFWFHPLIWWIGTRLIAERERACDEQVLADGHPPESYAEGILKVCEQYLQLHLDCAAGIGGAHLRRRIEAIVRNDRAERPNGAQKLLVCLAAFATIAAPIAVGALTAPQARALAETSVSGEPAFRDVSIQIVPGHGGAAGPCLGYVSRPDGRVTIARCSLRRIIAGVYGVSEAQVVGRDWSQEPSYEITAEDTILEAADRSAARRELPAMMRNLLTNQLGVVVKKERRQMDGYVLTIGPSGSKLKPYPGGPSWKTMAWGLPDVGISASDYPVAALAGFLSGVFKAPVINDTGLEGHFEYEVTWNAQPSSSVVAKALEEQLGLRLEAKRVTVDVIDVIGLKPPAEVVTRK